jgi:hypothetical protein
MTSVPVRRIAMTGQWPEDPQPPEYRPPPPPPVKRSLIGKVLVGVAVVVIGAAAGVAWSVGGGGGGQEGAVQEQPVLSAQEVQLEPTSASGANPFMAPIGQDQSAVAPPQQAQGQFSGDTPGLFAAAADKPSCDSASLLANLQADQPKAAAWADVLGVRAEDIQNFVQSLSPVLLRADTAVTEHGYDNGTFTAYPAVLQAGTAVFVNGFGEPTVKCFNGNPLTRPADIPQASYVGSRWQTFQPVTVTYVTPAPVVIKTYNYYDFSTKVIIIKQSPCWFHSDWWGCRNHVPIYCGDFLRCKGPPPDCAHASCKYPPPGCKQLPCKGTWTPAPSPQQFCRDNPKQCDSNGIPLRCKGVVGPGKDPLCTSTVGTGPSGSNTSSARESFCRDNPQQCDSNGIPNRCKGVVGPGNDPLCTTTVGTGPSGTSAPSPRDQFCRDNPRQCDSNGVPDRCRGIANPGNDPLCTLPASTGPSAVKLPASGAPVSGAPVSGVPVSPPPGGTPPSAVVKVPGSGGIPGPTSARPGPLPPGGPPGPGPGGIGQAPGQLNAGPVPPIVKQTQAPTPVQVKPPPVQPPANPCLTQPKSPGCAPAPAGPPPHQGPGGQAGTGGHGGGGQGNGGGGPDGG